jgi:hypothetical protein
VVYFESECAPGAHTPTGLWRRPDGVVDSTSPDVRIETTDRRLASYGTYIINAELTPGVWAFEVRFDGRPGGSHSFEVAGTAPPSAAYAESVPELPSLDQIFQAASRSLV